LDKYKVDEFGTVVVLIATKYQRESQAVAFIRDKQQETRKNMRFKSKGLAYIIFN